MSLTHVPGLFMHPDKEWRSIKDEQHSVIKIILTYLIFMAAIPAICGFFGTTATGWQLPGSSDTVYLTSESAITMSTLAYLAMLASIFFIAGFVHWMARTFGSSPSFAQCLAFTAYTASPLFIAGLIGLFPSLWTAMLVGITAISWASYLLYTGLPVFMDIPFERGVIFASSVLCVALVILVATMAATVTLWNLGAGPVYT
ncbi:YIP1 family protein [Sansalvadorimonas sp. 2012CJ34-2]|uniref:YIP1 family protein n=1 Tax=Parendozoicomonas callyspongiae TaxID=2942213 RepID=A0ABT0PJC0_9GAMM|nr:Yip1 family protein [Sansalvadorimonas sp. 2012CJ34-2]MCL6271479.1 YIP1 family protein [Sansalvadorimonas sp. 2012CJ34-2]